MSSQENKQLVRQFIEEVFNCGNTDAIGQFMREGTLLAGSYEGLVKNSRRAFPDLHYTIKDIMAEDDRVGVYADWSGTNTGTRANDEPPTGKQAVNTAFWFCKIADAKIVTMVG